MGWLLRLLRLRGEGYGAGRQRIRFVVHGMPAGLVVLIWLFGFLK